MHSLFAWMGRTWPCHTRLGLGPLRTQPNSSLKCQVLEYFHHCHTLLACAELCWSCLSFKLHADSNKTLIPHSQSPQLPEPCNFLLMSNKETYVVWAINSQYTLIVGSISVLHQLSILASAVHFLCQKACTNGLYIEHFIAKGFADNLWLWTGLEFTADVETES